MNVSHKRNRVIKKKMKKEAYHALLLQVHPQQLEVINILQVVAKEA